MQLFSKGFDMYLNLRIEEDNSKHVLCTPPPPPYLYIDEGFPSSDAVVHSK